MKTSKPFSTISYNSIDFLYRKLTDLVTRNFLTFFAFVFHYAEKDEKKDHIHLYMMPNGQVQTDKIKPFLNEMDPTDINKKPLTITIMQSSKFADWYLYGIHDPAYLASKGMKREYHYKFEDVYSSDPDTLLEMVHTIDYTKISRYNDFLQGIEEKKSFLDLVQSGIVPIPQLNQWEKLYNMQKNTNISVYRAEREHHDPKPLPTDKSGVLIVDKDGNVTQQYKNLIEFKKAIIADLPKLKKE